MKTKFKPLVEAAGFDDSNPAHVKNNKNMDELTSELNSVHSKIRNSTYSDYEGLYRPDKRFKILRNMLKEMLLTIDQLEKGDTRLHK